MMLIPQQLDEFDVEEAVSRMLDRPELWWQALGLFVVHFSDWVIGWQASIGDDALERRRVHAVRSAASNVGAIRLAEIAGQLETSLQARLTDGDVIVDAALRDALQQAFSAAWGSADTAWRMAGGDIPEAQ